MEDKSELKWASSEPTSMDFYLITKFAGWLPVPFKLDAGRAQAARSSGFNKVAFPTLNIINSELDCSSPSGSTCH